LAQPDLVHMLQECQQNPKNMNKPKNTKHKETKHSLMATTLLL